MKKAKQALAFLNFSNKYSQIDIDKKLVYSLSPRKIPTGRQFKYLKKFLNPKEYLVIKICIILIILNLGYLGITFIKGHVNYTPKAGGSYVEAIVGYPKLINPLYAKSRDVDNDLSRLIYSSLFEYNSYGEMVEDLVDDYQISEDGKEYIITIKEGVSWHNGEKLTIDDVIFTFNLIKDENYRSPLRPEFIGVEVEKINDSKVKFVLVEAYAPFLEMLTFGIMPKNIWENVGPDAASLNDLNLKPIGSGPYKFKSLIKSKSGDLKEYNLIINEDYYKQVPYIKNISFRFFATCIEAIKSFDSNQLNGLSYLPFSNREELLAKDSTNIFNLIKPQIVGIFFNQKQNKILEKKEVRAALAGAIDKNKIISEVFSDVYKTTDSPILKTNFAYGGEISRYDYNVDESKKVINDNHLKIVLTVIDLNGNIEVAKRVEQDWERIGVEVELRIITLEQASNVIKSRDFEAIIYGQSIGGDPDIFSFWHSTQTGAKGLNITGFNNEEVDKLLLEGRTESSTEKRKEKYYKLQELITAEIPAIFLYSPTYTYIQSKKIKGFEGQVLIEPADRFSNVSDWYIKTNKKLTW